MKCAAALSCVVATALALPASAKSDAGIRAELEGVCQKLLCRTPAVSLKLPDGATFEVTPSTPSPIVSGGLITVYAGETVQVEAQVESGRLVGLKAVPEITQPDRTLTFQLRQEPAIGDGTEMTLEVKSPFDGVLKYRLAMMLPTEGRLRKTSACPLPPGKASFEHWAHPIFYVVATDFRIVDPKSAEARKCE